MTRNQPNTVAAFTHGRNAGRRVYIEARVQQDTIMETAFGPAWWVHCLQPMVAEEGAISLGRGMASDEYLAPVDPLVETTDEVIGAVV